MNDATHISPIKPLDERSIAHAADLLRDSGLVGVPTETVYGLAADATNGDAVAAIFETKARPSFNPLICHVSDLAMAETLIEMNATALKLADAFWPGPLTLVLPKRADCPVHDLVTADLDTLAVRLPSGPMQTLAAQLGKPIAAPSANRSGRISATSAQAVYEELGTRVSLILDDGPTSIGVESTIVRVDGECVTLLRPGGVAVEQLEKKLGVEVQTPDDASIQAPGMMSSHYAPDMTVRLDATEVQSHEALLTFGDTLVANADQAALVINLSEKGDLNEAAQNLFSAMRAANASPARALAVAPIPEVGLGLAINDRLRRASAPKDGANG
ncbi:MAG: L-threonylcarbamoyladenylate synthase [Pseudomonadota bacterium]